MRHFTITFQPDGRKISIHSGSTLLDAAHAAGIILNTPCGGKGACKKCVVLAPDQTEVLACQHIIDRDLTVTVPLASRLFEQKILRYDLGKKIQVLPPVVKPADVTGRTYGLAVDIGTTTVVVNLVDLSSGGIVAAEADFNPQARHGDDVISRITFANTDENLTELQRLIIDCLNSLISALCKKNGIDPSHICEITAVGNTTMNHIFLHLPVAQLGHAPYRAYSLDAHDVPAGELGIRINPQANVHTVENIAGFVGSDTVAGALAVDINLADEPTLLVDIGTNGEIVCGGKDKLCAASCAAGPAFEGARISQGSRAVAGAIQAVVINDDDIDIDVIADKPPQSICGSGLVDAVAVMLDLGILDSTGRIRRVDSPAAKLPPAVAHRLVAENNQPAFVLAYDNGGRPAVTLTQQDIRQVQLAKAAIATGIRLLLEKLNLKPGDLDRILLAGAFGNYIKRSSALRIGLLPKVPPEKIHFVGNAAASGARMILLSPHARAAAGHLARKIQYVEIAHEPEFTNVFADSMTF